MFLIKQVSSDLGITPQAIYKQKEELQSKITFTDSNIIVFVKNGIENSILTRIDDTYISSDALKNELQEQGYLK